MAAKKTVEKSESEVTTKAKKEPINKMVVVSEPKKVDSRIKELLLEEAHKKADEEVAEKLKDGDVRIVTGREPHRIQYIQPSLIDDRFYGEQPEEKDNSIDWFIIAYGVVLGVYVLSLMKQAKKDGYKQGLSDAKQAINAALDAKGIDYKFHFDL